MTTSPRLDRRRDYRHFPVAYTELVEHFREHSFARIGPMTKRDAQAALRDLYRFKTFIINALDTDPSDDHARNLFNGISTAIMRVEATPTEGGGECSTGSPADLPPLPHHLTHVVTLTLNPIVAAMRQKDAAQ